MEAKAIWLLFSSLAIATTLITPTYSAANGGTDCAACVILISLAEQLSQVHATNIVAAADKLCNYLPSPLNTACKTLLNEYGEVLIDMVDKHLTADLACHDIGICTQDPGKDFCHLYPLPSSFNVYDYAAYRRPAAARFHPTEKYNFCNLPELKELCDGINRVSEHKPIQDSDDDGFSEQVNVLRGAFWKGRDCDDKNPFYYPGRIAINSDRVADSNCNGIHGVDPASGRPFEDLYCNKTQQRGIVILGDSAAAHFRIPENYLMPEVLNEHTFDDVLTLLGNEGDWPMLSSTTAISKENAWPHSVHGPIDSLYIRLREHNLCNHRDYQNIGVNGARSSSMNDIVKSLARRPFDKPQIVFLSLIGNDVCNGHVDTIAHMTTPTEFYQNTMVTLKFLETVLPKNSSVLITGLADGRVLWDLLSTRYHPIGQLNKDVMYKDLYTFLNCLEVSPCTGWMSTNATLRNFTSERAANLSRVAQNIANKEKFVNFDIHYIDFNIQAIIKMWQSQGGEAWEVIEPVDGFHPGQIAQALSAEYMWNQLQTKYPRVLGPANPNNSKIKEVFGNQGGH